MAPPRRGRFFGHPRDYTKDQGRGTEPSNKRKPCRYFLKTGTCRYGDDCRFLHTPIQDPGAITFASRTHEKPETTPEQQQAKSDYNAWKRLIKNAPRANDTKTMQSIWEGAFEILDGDDRDWKQMLARDLDDIDYFGREHMRQLLEMVTRPGGHDLYIELSRPFIMVITHPALLDCLSVDTYVGDLYNFFCGTNGSRAIPFLQRFIAALVEYFVENEPSESATKQGTTLVHLAFALRELLRREQRALFNDDLAALVASMEHTLDIAGIETGSTTSQVVRTTLGELRRMEARAKGLLLQEHEPSSSSITTNVTASTYPRQFIEPRDRHDNDKRDITKIELLPTQDEIRSDHPPFLPSIHPDQPHFLEDQVERYLDTLFRLFRHDVFGELSDALAGAMLALEANGLEHSNVSLGNFRGYSNPKAHVSYVSFDRRRGLEVQISFAQPASALQGKTASERQRWWDESKRMEEGSLLCLLTVKDTRCSLLFLTVSEKVTDPKKEHGLCSDKYHKNQATITTKLTSVRQHEVERITTLNLQREYGLLIEFPGVILGTFLPVLENIQNMQRSSQLPFRQWIIPDNNPDNPAQNLRILPPLYARSPKFSFVLDPILKDGNDPLSLHADTQVDDPAIMDELETKTHLDRGQCRAVVAALTREYAFIQGPPGTGKSYLGVQLMRILLASGADVELGPVIVVCYTNHALDQFLEHLIEAGIERIIRVGGQSKSDLLEGKNLRIVSKGESKAKSEGYLLAMTYKLLEKQEKVIQRSLGLLHGLQKRQDWANMKTLLLRHHPDIYSQFSRLKQDGFYTVGREPFDIWIAEDTPTSKTASGESGQVIEEILVQAAYDVYSLSSHDRRLLVKTWTQEIRNEVTDELLEAVKYSNSLHKQLSNVHDEVDRRVLQTADVIGVTTTGLAKKTATFKHIRAKVVIVEEAGEVMEPHLLSALLPSVQHFIQIGDHEQLRPQINNYSLSLESQQGEAYQLDRSQFERLSVGDTGHSQPPFPLAQLNVQRRMRPEISVFIRELIYPHLIDHDSTRNLPDVVGMRKNVFWLTHSNFEKGADADKNQKSHSNLWEVDMTHALVRHILRQGVYRSTDIAVLTPYTGQLQQLRSKMRNDFEIVLSERDEEALANEGFNLERSALDRPNMETGRTTFQGAPLQKKRMSELLRIATVDNFQGEEAKIVIVSMVRSNKARKVGFLKTRNRMNVLISRAQHGMYLIGNSDTYSERAIWARIQSMLQISGSIGDSIALRCPRHPETDIQASNVDDFARLSPEGGCQLICDRRLPSCGHQCQAKCHSESMHQAFACPKPCERLHAPCNHNCQKDTCGEDCGVCMIALDNIGLPCGHVKDSVPCYLTQDLKKVICSVLVEKEVPACRHTVKISCTSDVESPIFRCPAPCGSPLACGHPCPATCGQCKGVNTPNLAASKHAACSKICGRRFGTCNHTCPRLCHEGKDCGPCMAACEVQCAHSRCTLKCHEACAPCVERCVWNCEHIGKCNMPCAAPCCRMPCNERCTRYLSCGHQCPGLCGEKCPDAYCQSCSARGDARVDLLEMKAYREIDLNESPIVVLGCGHFFTAETLDGHMGMGEVYAQNHDEDYTGLNDVSAALARSIPRCPDCQCPVRQYSTQRYNRVINRAVIDEMSKRFLVNGKIGLQELQEQITALSHELENSQDSLLTSIRQLSEEPTAPNTIFPMGTQVNHTLKDRRKKALQLEHAIQRFGKKVEDKHQPAQKLHEATINAVRRRSLDQMMADLDVTDAVPAVARDRRITFGGRIAQVQAIAFILDDAFKITSAIKAAKHEALARWSVEAPEKSAVSFFDTCEILIHDCNKENLPKFSVEATLYYARIARSNESYCRSMDLEVAQAADHVKAAKDFLLQAQELCKQPFQNSEALGTAVEESMNMLWKEWYEEVTAEEMAAVKAAMLRGPQGMNTHSGHWYNCENGHPFAVGECGMPMQLARCPECGAPVGGQSHQPAAGVTRAINMED